MNLEEHKAEHVRLRDNLDMLVADWIMHTGSLPSDCRVMDLMKWAHEQTIEPTEKQPG